MQRLNVRAIRPSFNKDINLDERTSDLTPSPLFRSAEERISLTLLTKAVEPCQPDNFRRNQR